METRNAESAGTDSVLHSRSQSVGQGAGVISMPRCGPRPAYTRTADALAVRLDEATRPTPKRWIDKHVAAKCKATAIDGTQGSLGGLLCPKILGYTDSRMMQRYLKARGTSLEEALATFDLPREAQQVPETS